MSYTGIMPELSVVIPAYNEERRLPSTLDSVWTYLHGRGRSFEIIIVDDGSIDSTAQLVDDYAADHEGVRLISYHPNKGKGHAVRTGMLAAEGDMVLFNDADGSSPIEEVDRLEARVRDGGSEVAIGSRAKPDESRVVKALAYRKYIGNTFNVIVQSLLLPGIQDTQCGFKLFRRDVAQDLFSVQRLNGFAFDVEVLYIARIRGYSVDEVPINWTNVDGSKVNVLTDSPRMMLEVAKVALGAWTGRYRRVKGRSGKTKASNGVN